MSAENIDAIYQLREAAEEHGRVQVETAGRDDPAARDRRLAARENLEVKTQLAIEGCETSSGAKRGKTSARGQVIEGNFGAK